MPRRRKDTTPKPAEPTPAYFPTFPRTPKPGERHVLLAPGLPVLIFPIDAPRTEAEMTQEESDAADEVILAIMDILNTPDDEA